MNWTLGRGNWCILSYGWDKHQKIDHYFPFLKIEKLPVLRARLDWWNPFPPTFMLAVTVDILWVWLNLYGFDIGTYWKNTLFSFMKQKLHEWFWINKFFIKLTPPSNFFPLYYPMIKQLIDITCDLLLIFQTMSVVLYNSNASMCCH